MHIRHVPGHPVFKHIHEHAPVHVHDVIRALPVAKATSALNAATTPELGLIVFMDMLFEHKVGPMAIYVVAVVVRHGAGFVLKRTAPDGVVHHAAEHIIREVQAHEQEAMRDQSR